MRAAILHAAGQGLHIVERERPTPGVGQVLVRVRACGICHADLSLALGHLSFARYPTIPGHEIAGIIEELGPYVTRPKPWPDKAGLNISSLPAKLMPEPLSSNGQVVQISFSIRPQRPSRLTRPSLAWPRMEHW